MFREASRVWRARRTSEHTTDDGDDAFGYYETICGGSGGGPGWKGTGGVHTNMTNTRITDPEVLDPEQ